MSENTGDPESETEAPLRRPVSAAELSKARHGGLALSGAADAAERAAIAEAFGLLSLDDLSYAARLAPHGGDGWRLTGTLSATLAQACVITLAPAPARIEEPFERLWRPAEALEAAEADGRDLDDDWAAAAPLEEGPEIEPTPDPIDLGLVATETLSLALDPYPKAPGALFEGAAAGPPGAPPLTDEAVRPFAKLEALRERMADAPGEDAPAKPDASPRDAADPEE